MYSKSSGISRQITRLPPRCGLNRAESFDRCTRSITKIKSAHSSSSGVTGICAPWLSPADAVSMPGHDEKTCYAVGLRSRFWLQMKSTFRKRVPYEMYAATMKRVAKTRVFIPSRFLRWLASYS